VAGSGGWLQQAGDLGRRDELAAGRREAARPHPPVETAAHHRHVGAEERDTWDPQAGDPQVVLARERVEAGQQPVQEPLRPALDPRLTAQQQLDGQQRLRAAELAGQRSDLSPPLDQIDRLGEPTPPGRVGAAEVTGALSGPPERTQVRVGVSACASTCSPCWWSPGVVGRVCRGPSRGERADRSFSTSCR